MSIKIHHGPNGAYKTSGAIQDDAIPAVLEGRYIITNIRGFTLDRVLEQFPDAPKSLEVLNLSMGSSGDIEKIRTWFMWAPRGAFLIFDETQLLFPKSWREKDLERFDFPGGAEAAEAADRPSGWLDGWTRHRHWNWDIVLTTPNIRYIRDDIRLTCEKAYLHANLGVLGPVLKFLMRSDYKEAMHDAQENKPGTDGTIVQFKKIKPATFAVYDSTATGVVTDTSAGVNLFASPKILGLVGFVAALAFYLSSSGAFSIFTCGINCKPAQAAVAPPAVGSPAPSASPAPVAGGDTGRSKAARPDPVDDGHPFAGRTFYLRAVLSGYHNQKGKDYVLFDLQDDEGLSFSQNSDQLKSLGYRVVVRSDCLVELSRDDWKGAAICPGADRKAQADSLALARNDSKPKATAASPASLVRADGTLAGGTRVTVIDDTSRNEKPFAD